MKSGHWTGVRDTCYLRTAWPALVLLGNGCRLAGFTAFFRPWSAAVLAFLGLWVPSEAPRALGRMLGLWGWAMPAAFVLQPTLGQGSVGGQAAQSRSCCCAAHSLLQAACLSLLPERQNLPFLCSLKCSLFFTRTDRSSLVILFQPAFLQGDQQQLGSETLSSKWSPEQFLQHNCRVFRLLQPVSAGG